MNNASKSWAFGPFEKHGSPVVAPDNSLKFACPMRGEPVLWAASNVYNPAALVRDGKLHILYRADDKPLDYRDQFGNPMVTCRIGYAVSGDGLHFDPLPAPVLYPNNDAFKAFEWIGGCQDLHIVEKEDGTYYMNYTAWTGKYTPDNFPAGREEEWEDVLMVASSRDLVHWTKHGPAFADPVWKPYLNHSRSGVVVSRIGDGGKLVAAKIRDKYWMYFAHNGWLATSDDLIVWEPVLNEDRTVKCLFPQFVPVGYASASCEAGAGAILTERGIVYFFNACCGTQSEGLAAPYTWSLGQALISGEDMVTVLDVLHEPYLAPEFDWELTGHSAPPAVVCNSIVYWNGRWTLYYGAADRWIGRAVEIKTNWTEDNKPDENG